MTKRNSTKARVIAVVLAAVAAVSAVSVFAGCGAEAAKADYNRTSVVQIRKPSAEAKPISKTAARVITSEARAKHESAGERLRAAVKSEIRKKASARLKFVDALKRAVKNVAATVSEWLRVIGLSF